MYNVINTSSKIRIGAFGIRHNLSCASLLSATSNVKRCQTSFHSSVIARPVNSLNLQLNRSNIFSTRINLASTPFVTQSAPLRSFHSSSLKLASSFFPKEVYDRHSESDQAGFTSRNPHFDSFLDSPSVLLVHPRIDQEIKRFLYLLLGANFLVWATWKAAWLVDEHSGEYYFPNLLRFMHDNFTVRYENLKEGRVWTLFTAALSHESFIHLGMNMYGLWLFSPAVFLAMNLSRARYMGFYLAAAFSSSVAHMVYCNIVAPQYLHTAPGRVVDFDKKIVHLSRTGGRVVSYGSKTSYDIPALGASGSVMALVAAFACIHPRVKLSFLFVPFGIQAKYMLPAVLLFDLGMSLRSYVPEKVAQPVPTVSPTSPISWQQQIQLEQMKREREKAAQESSRGSRIAHWGHLGGALYGLAYYFLSLRRKRLPPHLSHPIENLSTNYYHWMKHTRATNPASNVSYTPTHDTSAHIGTVSAFTPRTKKSSTHKEEQ